MVLVHGLLQSVGGLSAAAMTRWWSSSGTEQANCPKNHAGAQPEICFGGIKLLNSRSGVIFTHNKFTWTDFFLGGGV